MILNELFRKKIYEGGNLSSASPGWMGAQDAAADEIDLKVHNRSFMVGILDKLLHDINSVFQKKYKQPLWSPELLQSKQFLGGSSLHFFNTKGISDQQFTEKKPKVGDIDTQCNKELEPQIEQFLQSIVGKRVGDTTFLGFSRGNEQLNGLFEFQDPPMKIQIDFEFGRYSPETNTPDDWYRFSHSSAWEDIEVGIKGVFHKYLYRSLAKAGPTEKYIAKLEGRGKARSMGISGPVNDANFSFAVASGAGGGTRAKYKPYIDPETGQPKIIDGIPVMEPVKPEDSDYIQDLSQQFELFFGQPPAGNDSQLQQSFVGTVELMKKYLSDEAKKTAFDTYLQILFEPGAQMITAADPARDREIKFASIDQMLERLGLKSLRPQAVAMAKEYEKDYNDVEAFKTANPNEKQPRAAMKKMRAAAGSLNEAEVKAQFRKNMPHLKDLKPIDFLDLLDELDQGDGQFKLKNIPLNVKVDGFGGRFGKNSEGQPFMATSRTEPRYQAGFVDYHQKKGTTDPEILGRAQLFDDLFAEMMTAVQMVDSKLGPDFLINKQVTCEVLYLPFATETPEGKLKFVGIHYDKLPEGVQLALVPFRVTDATTGDDVPESNDVIKQLLSVGSSGNVMFIDNSLTQNKELDVTEIINVLDNIEELKQIVSDTAGKRDRASLELRRQVEEKLQPVKLELEKAIINDPNIIGKDILGKDYEGIVINSRLGPIKITSQEQRDVITAKNATKKAAWQEQPRANSNKTAVVAIGSFIGHKGHEELFDYTIKKAAEVGGDPYLFIGNAEGKDDPIPPSVKVQTWHKLYPQYAKSISTVTQEGGTLIQKIKHELINPLPGKPPRYDNIIIMVGEDRAGMNMPNALMKAVNKFQGYEHVKVSLGVTPRGTGISGTALRNSLKNDPPEKALDVWSNAFDVKQLGVDWIEHLMDITRKGMGIQMPQKSQEPQPQEPQPAPIAERLFNALMKPKYIAELDTKKSWADYGMTDAETEKKKKEKVYHGWQDYEDDKPEDKKKEKEVDESTSIDSALKIVVNDIGEPITAVYDKLKFMAKRYVHDHGELNRGWKMVEMGEGARWVQGMYNAQLKGALYALTKYNPKRTGDLQQFLAGREVNGEIELKRSFNNISNELPEILAKVGNYIESPDLTKAARRWMQNKTEYENYVDSLGDDEDDYDTPKVKPEKSKLPGQQNAQADQIVNDILKRLPSKVAGDIRNAIARNPNKLQSLQAELQKRGVSAPMSESLIESAKLSAAVRLQKALQREKEKSDYSRRYAEKHFPIGKKPEPIEEPKKTVAEGSGGAKYKIKQIGAEGGKDFYISPNTGKKVYKKVNVGDHETPAGDHKPKIRMPYKEDVAEVTKQSAIKQYKDIQNYKHVDKPKKDEKEFIKITLSNPKKQGAVEGQDSCVKVNESIEHKMSKLISILKNK